MQFLIFCMRILKHLRLLEALFSVQKKTGLLRDSAEAAAL